MLSPLSLTLGITGILFALSGWIVLRNPPKRINWFYGYRTAASRRNQERWDFAQREGAKAMMQVGAALALLAIPCLFWWPVPAYALFLAILLLVASVVFIFWKVRGKIKRRFGP